MKVPVDTNKSNGNDDSLCRKKEAAHSKSRIIYSKDEAGNSIQNAILNELENNPNISIKTNCTAIDLLTLSRQYIISTDTYKKPACFSAMVLDNDSG